MMRQPAPAYGSENVGDVLASIRRLIAQDEATSPIIPNQTLNTLPRGLTAVPAQDAPRPLETALAPVETMPLAQVEAMPLVLETSKLIAPEPPAALDEAPQNSAEVVTRLHLPPAGRAEAAGSALRTDDSEAEPDVAEIAEPAPSVDAVHTDTIAEPAEPVPAPEADLAEVAQPQDFNPWRQAFTGMGFDPRSIWADPPQPETHQSDPPQPEPLQSEPLQSELLQSEPLVDDTAHAASPEATTAPTLSTTAQAEETMLQPNATVTPINPYIDAQHHAEIESARDGTEPHLFAPQDKNAQKGTHLRGMIRDAIRQELQGEIGNRLSRNLQQMIRHEIELTLRQMCEQE